MKKHHWSLIVFLALMLAMLLGGVAMFVHGVMHPQPVQPWMRLPLIPALG